MTRAQGAGRMTFAANDLGAALWTTYDQGAGRRTFAANDLGAALWTTYDQGAGRRAQDLRGKGLGRGGQGARSGDLLKHAEALQYNCQVWLTHCVGEQNAPWRHGYIVGMSGECRGSESVKICPGKVSAVLGSARKGNGHTLKQVCQNLSPAVPEMSQHFTGGALNVTEM